MFVFSSHSDNTTPLATPLTSFNIYILYNNRFDSNIIISKVIFKKRFIKIETDLL